MATCKHAPERLSSLAQRLTSELGFAPPSNDDLLEARTALDAGGKLSDEMAHFIARALNYFAVMLQADAKGHRRGRPVKRSLWVSALMVKECVDEGMPVKAAVSRVVGKDATPSDFENLKRTYHKLSKGNPRKSK